MRIRRAGCLAALGALWLASGSPAQAPGKDDPAGGSSWLSGLFGGKPKPPEKTTKGPAPSPVLTVADRSAEQNRLMNAYLRRIAVCDELRSIARQTNDTALEEEAARLDDLAFKVYQEQSNRLLGVAVSSPEPDPGDGARPVQDSGRVLRGVSPGGMIPPRVQSGGRLAPERSTRVREGQR
jgi:hypothetical protein